jgi:propanediol utilization protein
MNDELVIRVERLVREAVNEFLNNGHAIPISVSARHMHITQEHLEQLFGPGSQLTKMKDLLQPGEFAADQTVTIVGPNRHLFETVRILGPVRKVTQVEFSYTDGRHLGLELPARHSGDIKGTAPVILVGPKGVVHLQEGAIRALRHIHMSAADAKRLGVENEQLANVRLDGPMGLVFEKVRVRVGKNARLEMHIDTDEANAAGITMQAIGTLVQE